MKGFCVLWVLHAVLHIANLQENTDQKYVLKVAENDNHDIACIEFRRIFASTQPRDTIHLQRHDKAVLRKLSI